MGQIVPLIPKRLPNGMPVFLYQSEPEAGGFDIVIWRDDGCTDAFCIHAEDYQSAVQMIRLIGAEWSKRRAMA